MQINVRVLSNAQAKLAISFLRELLIDDTIEKDSVFEDTMLEESKKNQISYFQEQNNLPYTFYMEVE